MTKREEAQALVTDVAARHLTHSGAILSFRRAVKTGLPAAIRSMMAEDVAFVRKIAPEVMIGDTRAFVEGTGPELFAGLMVKQTA